MDSPILTTESFHEEKNQHVLTHWHDRIELLRVTAGSLHCTIDARDYKISAGDICMINEKHPHRIYCTGDPSSSFQCLMIAPSLFTADKAIYQRLIEPVLTDDRFSHAISVSRGAISREIRRLMDGIYGLEQTRPAAYELEVVAHLHLIFQRLYLLYQAAEKTASHGSADIVLFRRMADYIYNNYAEKLTLSDIASAGNVSRSKCSSVFREYAQHPPIDFLNLYRLEVGANYLRSTGDSIASIALRCGFGQQSYFNRLFLREYGMTPREYRLKKI